MRLPRHSRALGGGAIAVAAIAVLAIGFHGPPSAHDSVRTTLLQASPNAGARKTLLEFPGASRLDSAAVSVARRYARAEYVARDCEAADRLADLGAWSYMPCASRAVATYTENIHLVRRSERLDQHCLTQVLGLRGHPTACVEFTTVGRSAAGWSRAVVSVFLRKRGGRWRVVEEIADDVTSGPGSRTFSRLWARRIPLALELR